MNDYPSIAARIASLSPDHEVAQKILLAIPHLQQNF